ncbi:MAG: lysophospholipid acyltransferase family protein [Leptospirales bacterium]|nr:lysophospholipid acyltransferase family protein [Leptospirales bacterium]
MIFPLSLMPFRFSELQLFWFCRLLFGLSSSFRKRIVNNVDASFPDKSSAERARICRQNLRSLARLTNEFIHEPRIRPREVPEHIVLEPDGGELHRRLLSKGGILVLGHLGSWEWMGIGLTSSIRTSELHVLAKRQSNPWSNAWIERVRASQNIKLIYTDESPRLILQHLKKGNMVAFIADQDAGQSGEFYPFMGQLASTYQGPALFARMTDAPIVFCWSWHDERSRLHFQVQELPRPALDPKGDAAEWERQFTLNWVRLLEEKVRLFPEDYYWLHRRWHTRPADAQAIWNIWRERGVI